VRSAGDLGWHLIVEGQAMAKIILGFGLVTSLAILFAIATIGAPATGGVTARISEPQQMAIATDGCSTEEVALDEGYGVSRKIIRRKCKDAE
jgi:hypothetical protein